MKIKYEILWLDDNIDAFIEDDFISEIEKYIEDEGFEAYVKTTENYIDFFKELNNDYDLILTDYHMEGMNGDKVVEVIREKHVETEILFYTAKADLVDTKKLDRISFLETDSLPSDHEDAVIKKLKHLIDLTIKKFQDIIAMRGMIMNETSDLDAQQVEILESYIGSKESGKTDNLKYSILDEINIHFAKKLKMVNGDWKTKDSGFKKLMKDNFVFSAEYKMQTLSNILQELSLEDFSESYKTEIINTRNKFAHAKLEVEKDENDKIVRKFFRYGSDGITFDSSYCKEIRINIRKHKENLNKLQTSLNG